MESAWSRATQINVKKEEAAIFFEGGEFGNVEPSVAEQIILALQVEVEQPFRCAVRRNDSRTKAGLFCLSGELGPILVMTDFCGRRERERQTCAAAGIFCF